MNKMFLSLYPEIIDFSDSLVISLISILFVFIILFVIVLIISAMQRLFFSKKTREVVKDSSDVVSKPARRDNKPNVVIKDEDMMVAALIATIDYANETKKDVRLVSIKQIG